MCLFLEGAWCVCVCVLGVCDRSVSSCSPLLLFGQRPCGTASVARSPLRVSHVPQPLLLLGMPQASLKHGNAGGTSIAAELDALPSVQCGVRFSSSPRVRLAGSPGRAISRVHRHVVLKSRGGVFGLWRGSTLFTLLPCAVLLCRFNSFFYHVNTGPTWLLYFFDCFASFSMFLFVGCFCAYVVFFLFHFKRERDSHLFHSVGARSAKEEHRQNT